MEELLNIKLLEEEEMFHLRWDKRMLDLPLFSRDDGKIESA